MGGQQPDKTRRRRLAIAVMALLLVLALPAGAAWARYRYRESTDMYFAQKSPSRVYLWGGVKADGSFSALPANLTVGEVPREISFFITNGENARVYAGYTQQAQVRLLCSLGLGDSGNLTAELLVDEKVYTAVAYPISPASPIYASMGDGWVYCFVDEAGNELRWELEGGKLSTREMKLNVRAVPGVESGVLRLMVSAEG